MKKSDIGLIGLAVMGENLVLNLESKGYLVSVYNRTTEKTDNFLRSKGKDKRILGFGSLEEFVNSIEKPRKIILMIKAGSAIDETINKLMPIIDKGDIIIDGGNSHYNDTERRVVYLEERGFLFVGAGISGGEEGALKGPSIMPGGSYEAWTHVKPIFQNIAAHAKDGLPCCEWVGEKGSGHFVKMVHNGIEYGDIQIICEAYQIMRDILCLTAGEMHNIFKKWNEGHLESYLIEITRDILSVKDNDGKFLVDNILDTAGQKGTGKWTCVSSLEEGVPLTLINEAVYARFLSSLKNERVIASKKLKGPEYQLNSEYESVIQDIEHALIASKIISYAQGFSLMKKFSDKYNWNLDLKKISLIWRSGCIIRSEMLDNIAKAFENNPKLQNLMTDDYFSDIIHRTQAGWRRTSVMALSSGIPVPSLTSALSYYDGYRCERSSANLLQAQRDYFGAHTYERTDGKQGEFFHTDWQSFLNN